MDDFYQFMSPVESTKAPEDKDKDKDRKATPEASSTSAEASTAADNTTAASNASSRSSWGGWGASFNKMLERGRKDMNEFVDVTRKDLNELVQTVQAESSTTMESLSKRVEGIKTTLPPLPSSVNSADILGRVSHVVGDIKKEITEAATGLSSFVEKPEDAAAAAAASTSLDAISEDDAESKDAKNEQGKDRKIQPKGDSSVLLADSAASNSSGTSTTPAVTNSTDKTSTLSFASTASLFSAGATTLTQTFSSGTKEISTSANQLLKTLPGVAEKHLGDADQFLKSTTESLKTNGLLAEQYVNKFGAGMANFINSAVVISAPAEREATATRSKKMVFDRKAAILEKLRLDPATYTSDPLVTIAENDIVGMERYKYFLQTFNMAEYQQRISRLLNEYPEVKALMNKLVPAEVADEELFWLRYHFRLFEIEEEEKRRKKLVQEVRNDLAEEEFTWDDNGDSDDEEQGESAKDGSVTPKATAESGSEKKDAAAMTPKATETAAVKREPLIAEALASSLSALPIPSEEEAASAETKSQTSEENDEWGSESLKSTSSPIVKSPTATKASGVQSKSPTVMSSTRTSEDAYEVVNGVETPVRVPLANVLSLSSSSASSPVVEQPAQQSSKQKSSESKDEDDWSDWE